ncbi:hypothetical protein [Paractinoplanes globisporus]|uniref:Uncharacterized protein n=1 Tax=Paractinoplanes globisporus TaxID=113565 RepID=A0ABW6WBA6_9ACTN|nr:hypothetical protein [Actinoplanes globisporus]
MSTSTYGPGVTVTPAPAVSVIPVRDGEREVGAWIVGPEAASFRPVVDVTRLAGAVLATAGAVLVATAVTAAATRHRPAIGAVTMGPGGWVSVKRAGCPPLRTRAHRPWWARVLRAERID